MRFSDEIAKARSSGKPPMFLGETFDAEARPLAVQGSTVVGHVRQLEAVNALKQAQLRIAASIASHCVAWLPPESFHVTWLRLLDRRSEHDLSMLADWQDDLRGRAADIAIAERLNGLALPTRAPYRLKLDEFWHYADAIGFWVSGETSQEDERIQKMRDAIETASGLTQRPRGIEYRLHITFGYIIAWPEDKAAKDMEAAIDKAEEELRSSYPVFEFGAPEVSLFEDLTEFPCQFLLGD